MSDAMQNMVKICQTKGIVMLKLGCSVPDVATFCLHISTCAKFYAFTEGDEDLQ